MALIYDSKLHFEFIIAFIILNWKNMDQSQADRKPVGKFDSSTSVVKIRTLKQMLDKDQDDKIK